MVDLIQLARETVRIVERGAYTARSGRVVGIAQDVARAVEGTVLHVPEALAALLAGDGGGAGGAPRVTVTDEKTGEAAQRLTAQGKPWVALNFASARNPGGGFLRGARAQEEDLARCSALYACLHGQVGYYNANRHNPSLLYTDHIIHSPGVPFFRSDDGYALLEDPFLLSVITAPAPNAGEHLARDPDGDAALSETLLRRTGLVLAVAQHHGHRNLILGAWGCGVFRNDPAAVAHAFHHWLHHPRFAGAFEDVVFAVFDPSDRAVNRRAFQAVFPR